MKPWSFSSIDLRIRASIECSPSDESNARSFPLGSSTADDVRNIGIR